MIDLKQFCNIPFLVGGRDERGCDCWGLFRLVFEAMTGIKLPLYDEVSGAQNESFQIQSAISSNDWIEINEPRRFAGIHMDARYIIDGKQTRLPNHVGLMVDDKTIIHTVPAVGVNVTRLNHPSFKRMKIRGCYLHRSII